MALLAALCCYAAAVAVLAATPLVAAALFGAGALPPLSSRWAPLRNPPWAAARWRGAEQPVRDFAQWWYLMLSDAETGRAISIGLGAFRGANTSGGWLKSSAAADSGRADGLTRGSDGADDGALIARATWPFARLSAAPAPDFDIRISPSGGGEAPVGFRFWAVSDTRLRLEATLPPPAKLAGDASLHSSLAWAWAELEFERDYGVFGTGEAAAPLGGARTAEKCELANLPFAYASRVRGRVCVRGGCGRLSADSVRDSDSLTEALTPAADIVEVIESDRGRWRAYIESTISCGAFPAPGPSGEAHPEEFPWKWMWAVVPSAADGEGQQPRGGRERGEIGLVMSQARLAVPVTLPAVLLRAADTLGVITLLERVGLIDNSGVVVELDVDGAFSFVDLPGHRIGGANVTLNAYRLLFASQPTAGALVRATLWHGEWEVFSDVHGAAALPTRQTLHLTTEHFAAVVTFKTEPRHYVRLAVRYPASGGERVVSDFRASAASAYIRVAARGGARPGVTNSEAGPNDADAAHLLLPSGYGDLLFEGYAPHNALEFAYHAEYADGVA